MAYPQCSCNGCRARREAAQKWVVKNREKVRAKNAAWKRKQRDLSLEVSDEELDRRALAMEAR